MSPNPLTWYLIEHRFEITLLGLLLMVLWFAWPYLHWELSSRKRARQRRLDEWKRGSEFRRMS